jgi:hypothetical protein
MHGSHIAGSGRSIGLNHDDSVAPAAVAFDAIASAFDPRFGQWLSVARQIATSAQIAFPRRERMTLN